MLSRVKLLFILALLQHVAGQDGFIKSFTLISKNPTQCQTQPEQCTLLFSPNAERCKQQPKQCLEVLAKKPNRAYCQRNTIKCMKLYKVPNQKWCKTHPGECMVMPSLAWCKKQPVECANLLLDDTQFVNDKWCDTRQNDPKCIKFYNWCQQNNIKCSKTKEVMTDVQTILGQKVSKVWCQKNNYPSPKCDQYRKFFQEQINLNLETLEQCENDEFKDLDCQNRYKAEYTNFCLTRDDLDHCCEFHNKCGTALLKISKAWCQRNNYPSPKCDQYRQFFEDDTILQKVSKVWCRKNNYPSPKCDSYRQFFEDDTILQKVSKVWCRKNNYPSPKCDQYRQFFEEETDLQKVSKVWCRKNNYPSPKCDQYRQFFDDKTIEDKHINEEDDNLFLT